MTQTRQLAAIMFTDIVGYTKIMEVSESSAVQLRQKHREVFESVTAYVPGSASFFQPTSDDLTKYYEFHLFLEFVVKTGRAVFYPIPSQEL